jgi:hypothetical protein
MGESSHGRASAVIRRRTVAKAAAWSVPTITVAAATPAYAASNASVASVVGVCAGRSRTASFTVSVTNIPDGEQIQVSLSTTSGSFTAQLSFVPAAGAGTPADPYIITGTGSPFQGVIGVTFTLPQNGQATITATVAGVDPFTLTGDTSASVTKRRDGNSSNYPCV